MEWYTTEDGLYRIQSMSPATVQGGLNVIKDSFFADEPVCIATEVDKSEKSQEELLELCADAALDCASIVAVYVPTGEVVSVVFNKLQVKNTDPVEKSFFEVFYEERCQEPSTKELMKFMIDIDSECNLFDIYNTDCTLEIMFMGTHRDHRRKNLATLTCQYSCELAKRLQNGPIPNTTITAKDLGPKYAHIPPRKPSNKIPKAANAIFSAPGSKKVGHKLNFTLHKSFYFDDFVYNGKKYSERIGDYSKHCELVSKAIE